MITQTFCPECADRGSGVCPVCGRDTRRLTAERLMEMGFRLDMSHGHPIYVREAVEEGRGLDDEGCHTALQLLPPGGGKPGWIAEIHNWQTIDGERVAPIDQRVALPRLMRTVEDVRRLCDAIAAEWF